jgi:hypothetical protein
MAPLRVRPFRGTSSSVSVMSTAEDDSIFCSLHSLLSISMDSLTLNLESWLPVYSVVMSSMLSSRMGDGIARIGEKFESFLIGELLLKSPECKGCRGETGPLVGCNTDGGPGNDEYMGVGILPDAN